MIKDNNKNILHFRPPIFLCFYYWWQYGVQYSYLQYSHFALTPKIANNARSDAIATRLSGEKYRGEYQIQTTLSE